MLEFPLPPGLLMILGAGLLPLVGPRARGLLLFLIPGVSLAMIWTLPPDYVFNMTFMGFTLEPLSNTTTGRLFATAFALMVLAGGLYAYRQANTLELVAALFNAGSAIGVVFAGDLITLFIFWELMALSSTLVLWAADTPGAYRASMRYLLIHLFGGMLLLTGITGHALEAGSVEFAPMRADTLAHGLILAGVLLNAGAPPLSAWIADAYPEASPSGSVFLSAFTTKSAVFTLIMGFPGETLLIPIGLYMVFYGITYALLENDMRRILAYSIVNQVGFMVTGVGLGTEMALNGAAAHAFAHIIYEGLLMMAAGTVLYQTGRRKCTELGGLFQSMPWTTLFATIGALTISAFPFTSGFISKSMISQSAADQQMAITWLALTAGSAGIFLLAGIRLPWLVFFRQGSGLRPPEPPWNMLAAMALMAFGCLFLGIYPAPLYALLPYPVGYHPYTGAHLVAQYQLLLFAGLAFFLMLPQMKRTLTISLDFDWFYRRFFNEIGSEFTSISRQAREQAETAARHRLARLIAGLFKHLGPTGVLARSWPTGSMVLWVAVLLALSLVIYYL